MFLEMSSAAIMMITCPSAAVAKKLASSAVKSRLAACGNIIPGMTSIYEWKGRQFFASNLKFIVYKGRFAKKKKHIFC